MEPSSTPPPSRCTLVTPTYLPDLARCELLVESVQRCCPGLPHHLIVDHRDLAHFDTWPIAPPTSRRKTSSHCWVRRPPGRRHSGPPPSRCPPGQGVVGVDLRDERAFGEFLATFDPASIGVMIHSKDRIEPARSRRQLEQMSAAGP